MRRAWTIGILVLVTLWVALPGLLTSIGADVTIRTSSSSALLWLCTAFLVTIWVIARSNYQRAARQITKVSRLRRWGGRFLTIAVIVFFWLLIPVWLMEALNPRFALIAVTSPSILGLVWFAVALIGTLIVVAYWGKQMGNAAHAQHRRQTVLALVQDHLTEGLALYDHRLVLAWANAAARRYLYDDGVIRVEVDRLIRRSADSHRSTSQSLTLSELERVNVQAAPTTDGYISVIARPIQNESDAATLFYERFMRRIVHDMRNPLAAVIAHASNLRALEDGQSTVSDLRATALTIENEAQRLTRLVDSLLFDARLSYVPPASEKLDLLDVIEDVYFQHDERAIREGKTLEIDSSLKAAPLEADRDMLVRAISNLVDNSLKYSSMGAAVRITLEHESDQYVLKVIDTGDGIPPELLPDKIFEALVRGRSHDGGSGLGLSIVKKIIELHHGSIAAESMFGRGTTITVWLPT